MRKLKDDFPSIADRIEARLTPPADDTYFTNLLKVISWVKSGQEVRFWR